MEELILTIAAVVFITLAWFAMKHFRKNDATNNPEAEELPLSTSSSSQVPSEVENQAFEYDVFLSFRGEDTRRGFTSHLYHKLKERGLRAFIDEVDLKKGERITTLLQHIKRSNICIPILSKRYAESRWCLMEIAKMVECQRIVIPVFYDVVPSDVRRQRGQFAEEFAKHQKREDAKKVKEWRKVLSHVGDIAGYDLTDNAMGSLSLSDELVYLQSEAKLIDVILKDVQSRLGKIRMEVAKHPVGIESRVDHMLKLLDLNSISDVRMVGIHGEGGLGKTTISKAVYNQLLNRFENRCCFLHNVRETANRSNGLASLQARLIKDILQETDVTVSDVEHGIATIKERIKSKRILLILDDVDSKEQLDKLAGDAAWFGAGSRIIISTRNEEILDRHRVVLRYQPAELDPDESLKLFSRHAFENDQPHLDYVELSKEVVEYAGGLPLALEVFGPIFFTIRNKQQWMERLRDLHLVQHEDISKRLRISYEALGLQEKCVFLDIACCLIGWKTEGPQYMWKAMKFQSVTIKALQQKSLVKIDEDDFFAMHDQIRDMGRSIVKEESFDDPGNRSRLWDASEISKVLETERRDNIQVITLNSDVAVSGGAFEGMPKLRILSATNLTSKEDEVLRFPPKIKCLFLKGCHSKKTLAFETSGLQELVELHLSESEFSEISWDHQAKRAKVEKRQPFHKTANLKLLTLNKCESLTVTPDLSGFPWLEKLVIHECSSLAQVHGSIGLLHNLTHLSMTACQSVTHLPENCGKLESLEYLNLRRTPLKRIPDSINGLTSLKELDLYYTELEELPDAIGKLESLEWLDLENTLLKRIPDSINGLTSLKKLNLSSTKLEELPGAIGKLESLERLYLDNTLLKRIPDSINGMASLKGLKLSSTKLEELPDAIGKLGSLEWLDLENTLLKRIPDSINGLTSLKRLKLSSTKLEELPDAIGKLGSLKWLDLKNTLLKRIPDSINGLTSLKGLNLSSTKLEELPDAIGKLGSLEWLDLENTLLKRIPDSINGLTSLKRLSLSSTKLEELPDAIGKLESLEWLYLENTLLKRIPNSINGLTSLTWLQLSSTKLEELPDAIWKLGSLEVLELENTLLKRIPDSINGLTSLNILNLSSTKLEELPDAIWKLGSLEVLHLNNTLLKRIPDSINGLTSLKGLKLSSTKLEELPDAIGKLGSLEWLDLENTLLKRIPDSINGLTSLKGLKLSSTKLEELPDAIGKLGSLEWLDLENTLLKRIPDSINGLTSLKELYLSSTKLEELPDAIWKLGSLEGLDLKNTLLKRIPNSINGLTSLKILKLSSTKLEELPDAIWKLGSLEGLDLENTLWQRIPNSINCLTSLKKLHMSSTKLEELRDAIGKLELLEGLDLANTLLKRIPNSINGLTSLKGLKLSSTKLEELPDAIWKLGSLEVLHLDNTLLKRIPDSINGLTSLKFLNLSSTKLEELPDAIGKLESLELLDLENALLKRIPDSINGLTSLRELDLSRTKLEELPDAIGKLGSLEWLDLENTLLKSIVVFFGGASTVSLL